MPCRSALTCGVVDMSSGIVLSGTVQRAPSEIPTLWEAYVRASPQLNEGCSATIPSGQALETDSLAVIFR